MTTGTPSPPPGFEPFPPPGFDRGFASHGGGLYGRHLKERFDIGFWVLEQHCNPVGICHGGWLMTVLDMALGISAVVKFGEEVFAPTINLSGDFLAPAPKGVWVEARADFVEIRGRTGFAAGAAWVEEAPVVRASGVFKLPKPGDARFQRTETGRDVGSPSAG